jgi:hypothetical protein
VHEVISAIVAIGIEAANGADPSLQLNWYRLRESVVKEVAPFRPRVERFWPSIA